MKKLIVILLTTAIVTPAYAWYPMVPVVPKAPPVVTGGGNAAGGAWAAGGIIGIAAFLAGYDIARRWTCLGDPLHLGGPGFTEPNRPYENVKTPPVCAQPLGSKKRGVVLRVRG
jgi:hypothetical protein